MGQHTKSVRPPCLPRHHDWHAKASHCLTRWPHTPPSFTPSLHHALRLALVLNSLHQPALRTFHACCRLWLRLSNMAARVTTVRDLPCRCLEAAAAPRQVPCAGCRRPTQVVRTHKKGRQMHADTSCMLTCEACPPQLQVGNRQGKALQLWRCVVHIRGALHPAHPQLVTLTATRQALTRPPHGLCAVKGRGWLLPCSIAIVNELTGNTHATTLSQPAHLPPHPCFLLFRHASLTVGGKSMQEGSVITGNDHKRRFLNSNHYRWKASKSAKRNTHSHHRGHGIIKMRIRECV